MGLDEIIWEENMDGKEKAEERPCHPALAKALLLGGWGYDANFGT